MNREKQIEEIANDLNFHCCSLAEQYCGEMSCNACLTNWLYTAGYRKSTDVAREIFEEIEKVVNYALCVDITDWSAYNELKKKYTEEIKGGEADD